MIEIPYIVSTPAGWAQGELTCKALSSKIVSEGAEAAQAYADGDIGTYEFLLKMASGSTMTHADALNALKTAADKISEGAKAKKTLTVEPDAALVAEDMKQESFASKLFKMHSVKTEVAKDDPSVVDVALEVGPMFGELVEDEGAVYPKAPVWDPEPGFTEWMKSQLDDSGM